MILVCLFGCKTGGFLLSSMTTNNLISPMKFWYTGVPVYLASWTGCPPGGKPTMDRLPRGGNLSRDILPPTLVIFTPGGQRIPAGLSCPPGVKINQPGYLAPHPWFWSSNCPEILKLLLISQACINGIFHIIQIPLLVVTLTNFLGNSPFLGGPHPAFWSSN